MDPLGLVLGVSHVVVSTGARTIQHRSRRGGDFDVLVLVSLRSLPLSSTRR
jgi:hypothetical protein